MRIANIIICCSIKSPDSREMFYFLLNESFWFVFFILFQDWWIFRNDSWKTNNSIVESARCSNKEKSYFTRCPFAFTFFHLNLVWQSSHLTRKRWIVRRIKNWDIKMNWGKKLQNLISWIYENCRENWAFCSLHRTFV